MPNARRFNIPHWFAKSFPENEHQTLDEYLTKMQKLRHGENVEIAGKIRQEGWSGYSKTPEEEKAIIWGRAFSLVKSKGIHLTKLKAEIWKGKKVLVARYPKGTVVNGKKVGGRLLTWVVIKQ